MVSIITKYFRFRDRWNGRKRLKYLEKATFEYGLYNGTKRDEIYIVSMASYAGRYNVLPIALKSLLLQEVKPDHIIVWLDEENSVNKLSIELRELKKYGVEFRFTNDNLKPHKKYLYVMKEFPNANIITVDDDVVYSSDLIGKLIEWHKRFPKCVCARRVHKITFDTKGNLDPYVKWKYEYRGAAKPSLMLCATGGGGTLYPPNLLPHETLDINLIKELSLEADDIWLKFMELKSKINVVWVKSKYVMPLEIESSQSQSLNTDNVGEGRNDIFIKRLIEKYPEALGLLREAYNDQNYCI